MYPKSNDMNNNNFDDFDTQITPEELFNEDLNDDLLRDDFWEEDEIPQDWDTPDEYNDGENW